ncbi:MafI family immunity protein [Microbacterium sp.]|uniref:MafI family immunity protein n=1 Tax=Microbacterium sp. TaxID=51671 RepID=UPI003A87773F
MNEWKQTRRRLSAVLVRLDDRLAHDDVKEVRSFIAAGEYGLALELIADACCEHDVALRDDERAEMLALYARMELSDRVPVALSLCPAIGSRTAPTNGETPHGAPGVVFCV